MQAVSTFATSTNFYQTTRRSNPEDSHISLENLKSHRVFLISLLAPVILSLDFMTLTIRDEQ
jgi:hypothetical protein